MTRPFQALLGFVLSILTVGFLPRAALAASTDLDYRLDASTEILQDLRRIPETAIPPNLLNRAYAVAVIPSIIKAGFIIGGSYGTGILVARRADGQWGNPAFVTLTAGSFGFQAGVQSTDLILVFKSQRALDGLSSGKITLGGDASIAAGPVGRTAAAATDVQMRSEIYSYARSKGLFAGVSVSGAVLSIDRRANHEYYESAHATTEMILTDATIPSPLPARRFLDTLAAMAPAMPVPEGARAASRPPARDADMDASPPAGARTFGIDDGAAVPPGDGKY
jgi:lipid-binding SYLF domain-containing protein